MVSPAINVLRYSSLLFGISYGVLHRRTLQVQFDQHQLSAELHKRERWVKEAKSAWQRLQAGNDGLVTDPDAPGFDLEKLLLSFEK